MFYRWIDDDRRYEFSREQLEGSVELLDDYYENIIEKQSLGWTITKGQDGCPVAVEFLPLSKPEQISAAEYKKESLLMSAKQHISIWQTQLQLGMISDTDKASLIVWMNYITALQAVDTSTAPDINWPTPPDA